MNIKSFSIVAGTAACNASCPFCISKMTGIKKFGVKPTPINWINFKKACRIAQINNLSTVLITGKGEPTLYPDQISNYLKVLSKYDFPIIELQTNGLNFMDFEDKYIPYLEEWFNNGLGLIAISIVSIEEEKNRKIYTPNREKYIDLETLINKLHKIGYSIRFSVTLIKGFADDSQEIEKVIKTANKWGVEQIALRPVAMPNISESKIHAENTRSLLLSEKSIKEMEEYLNTNGHKLATYGHGSVIYDVFGQNVCLTNALTIKPQTEDIRQMIFYPNGNIKFDWQYEGATIL